MAIVLAFKVEVEKNNWRIRGQLNGCSVKFLINTERAILITGLKAQSFYNLKPTLCSKVIKVKDIGSQETKIIGLNKVKIEVRGAKIEAQMELFNEDFNSIRPIDILLGYDIIKHLFDFKNTKLVDIIIAEDG